MQGRKWGGNGSWGALACLLLTLASTLPSWAVQATLQVDAHVSAAQPAVNSGALLRVLERFANLNIVPDRLNAVRGVGEICIEIEMTRRALSGQSGSVLLVCIVPL